LPSAWAEPSPSSQTLGFELIEMDVKAGTARVVFDGKPAFANPTGYIQGGFLSAMLDDVMGMMAMLKVAPKSFASPSTSCPLSAPGAGWKDHC
jgi:acyl-coenzyme A thioesterase PaaI-like protein